MFVQMPDRDDDLSGKQTDRKDFQGDPLLFILLQVQQHRKQEEMRNRKVIVDSLHQRDVPGESQGDNTQDVHVIPEAEVGKFYALVIVVGT